MCDVFRFVDDLNTINDAGIFESNFIDIYPKELELHRENGNNAEATFLDLDIKIKKSFPYSIVRMPEKSSNIPSNIFCMSTGAECLRIENN